MASKASSLPRSESLDERQLKKQGGPPKLSNSVPNLQQSAEDLKSLTVQIATATPARRLSAYSPDGIAISPATPGNEFTHDGNALGFNSIDQPLALPPIEQEYAKSMRQIVDIYEIFKAKEYMRGWLYKKNDLLPDGKKFSSRDWMLFYVSQKGPVMTFWKAPDGVHLLAQNTSETGGLLDVENAFEMISKLQKTHEPSFINISDATVEWVGVFQKAKQGKSHRAGIFSLNSAGANRFFLQPIPTTNTSLKAVAERLEGMVNDGQFQSTDEAFLAVTQDPALIFLHHWVASVRLATFEESLLSQIYTDILLHCRPDLCVIQKRMFCYDANQSSKDSDAIPGEPDVRKIADVNVHGWLQVRVAGTTEWKQYYCVVERRKAAPKKAKDNQLTIGKGHILFFESKKDYEKATSKNRFKAGKPNNPLKLAMFEMITCSAVRAVFPEKAELVNLSTIFKVEGGSMLLGGKSPKTFLQADSTKFDFGTNVDHGLKVQQTQFIQPNFILCMARTQAEMARWIFALWSVFSLNGKGPQDFSLELSSQDPAVQVSIPRDLPANCIATKILTSISFDYTDPLFLNLEDISRMEMRSRKMDDYRDKLMKLVQEKSQNLEPIPMDKRTEVIKRTVNDVKHHRRRFTLGVDEKKGSTSDSLFKSVMRQSTVGNLLDSAEKQSTEQESEPQEDMLSLLKRHSSSTGFGPEFSGQEAPKNLNSNTQNRRSTVDSLDTAQRPERPMISEVTRALSVVRPEDSLNAPQSAKTVSSGFITSDTNASPSSDGSSPVSTESESEIPGSEERNNPQVVETPPAEVSKKAPASSEEARLKAENERVRLELENLKLRREMEILKAHSVVGSNSPYIQPPQQQMGFNAAYIPQTGIPPQMVPMMPSMVAQSAPEMAYYLQQQQNQLQQIQLQNAIFQQQQQLQAQALQAQQLQAAQYQQYQAMQQPLSPVSMSMHQYNQNAFPNYGMANPYGARLPSPTPSESASAIGERVYFDQTGMNNSAPPSTLDANRGLLASIPDKNTTRSMAYNPRLGVMQPQGDKTRTSNSLPSSQQVAQPPPMQLNPQSLAMMSRAGSVVGSIAPSVMGMTPSVMYQPVMMYPMQQPPYQPPPPPQNYYLYDVQEQQPQ